MKEGGVNRLIQTQYKLQNYNNILKQLQAFYVCTSYKD